MRQARWPASPSQARQAVDPFFGESPVIRKLAARGRAHRRLDAARPDPRRDGHGQGRPRALAPPERAARRGAVRRPQLRGPGARAPGDRALRPREGRVHGRGGGQAGSAGDRASRDALPRRDRRRGPPGPGQAAEGGRGAAVPAARATCATARSTCGSSPPPTATSARWSRSRSSARTSTTASARSRSWCRRCASAERTSSCWRGGSWSASAAEMGRPGVRLSGAAEQALQSRPWPGNVRQLRNVLERAMLLSDQPTLEPRRRGRCGRPAAPARRAARARA